MYLAITTSPLLTKNSLYLFYKKGKGYYLPIVTFFYSPYLFFFFGGGDKVEFIHLVTNTIVLALIRKHIIMYLLFARLLFPPILFVRKPFSVVPPPRNIVFYVCWIAESDWLYKP